MSIQDIFYLFGTIYMVMGILLMIIIVFVLLIIKGSIARLTKLIEEKVNSFSRIAEDPSDVAVEFGSKMASKAVRKVKEMMSQDRQE